MEVYYTVRAPGFGEYEEKRSRFLGKAVPVSSEEEIQEHLARIRKQYYDARHHCYAYVLGEKGTQKRSSDDGEPSGSAGNPILHVIETGAGLKAAGEDGTAAGIGLTNVLVVVTRYFGGTLLGTGGLVRSYTEGAVRALKNAGIVCMREGVQADITLEYSLLDRVNWLLERAELETVSTDYSDKVKISVLIPMNKLAALQEDLRAAGNGTIILEITGNGFFPFDLNVT